jgi:hypothetical protein
MQIIRAIYTKDNRQIKRGYRSHINDNGLPLCRLRNREGMTTQGALAKWAPEFGEEPSCPVCARMQKRRSLQGGAA